MKVVVVVGTRPELIRLSLTFAALDAVGIEYFLVHTGQNYDPMLSDVFFRELELPSPDRFLGIRESTAAQQIGEIIKATDLVLRDTMPDAVLILGDTNSGLAAIPAERRGVPVFHMEAGNRCFDRAVPEELNRKIIDHASTWLLPYTMRSREYLLAEGIPPNRILVSGNPITDILEHNRAAWEASDALSRLSLTAGEYILATVHRQEAVDVPERLASICDGLSMVASDLGIDVVWSVHPRTHARLQDAGYKAPARVRLIEPLGFHDFVALEASAKLVITDSGTVQEECSLLMVPTVTCRRTTERPETLESGSNVLCGVDSPKLMISAAKAVLQVPRPWTSPYAGSEHRGVAERVAAFLVGQAR